MPIGIESCLNLRESINSPNSGRNFPTNKPTTMHMAIQRVRYFSKIPRVSDFSDFGESAKTHPIQTSGGITNERIKVFKYVVSTSN
jgi:hypothetical protein